MKKVALIFMLAVALAGCSKSVPTASLNPPASSLQIDTPSLAGISEHARGEAMAAFERAKQFIATSGVETVKLDLSRPQIFHRPDTWPIDYDWSVQFSWKTAPSKSPYGIGIAVKNDGTCWVLK